MSVVRGAVGCAVVAVVAAHHLSGMEPAQREALWIAARTLLSSPAGTTPPAAARVPEAPLRVVPAALSPSGGVETIAPDRLGQFETAIEIGGRRLSALVDTGASFVSLTAEDADRLGIHPLPSAFRYAVSTANGQAVVAKVELPSVRLGSIELRDVTALVSGRGQLGQTLLGMSFLSRLSRLGIEHGRLVLGQ